MYKVLEDFQDLRDNGYQYHTGDSYPRDGLSLNKARAESLSKATSMRGALIQEVKEEPKAKVKPQDSLEIKQTAKKGE